MRINQLVDSTLDHHMLSFLDSFSRYHQIKMKDEVKERTYFITYCYKVMLFGLKNAKTPCKKLVAKVFWIKNWSLVGR